MPSYEPIVHSKVEREKKMHLKLVTKYIAAVSLLLHSVSGKKEVKKQHTLQNETTNKRIKLLPNFTHTSFICTDRVAYSRGAPPQISLLIEHRVRD